MDPSPPIFGLVCAGGGAHGAYQVGVLKYIHEKFCADKRSPFQVFAGSSCGSLNTSFYAAESHHAFDSRLLLEELWLGFHVPAYHRSALKSMMISSFRHWRRPKDRATWSLLDPAPMRAILQKGFRRKNLERAFDCGSTLGIAVAATELVSGRACWFLEGPRASAWNIFHSLGVCAKIEVDHLAASCSVPVFLPPVKIGRYYFLDGSVSLVKPLSAALSMGASRILSIATDRPLPLALPEYESRFRPRISHVIRMLLNRLSHDSAWDEITEIQTFNRFYEALSRKSKNRENHALPAPLFHDDAKPSDYQPVEVFQFSPSRRIRDSFGIAENPQSLPRKKTRFMFHKRFIRELIDLGYRDASSRHDDLGAFFAPSPKARRRWLFFMRRRRA